MYTLYCLIHTLQAVLIVCRGKNLELAKFATKVGLIKDLGSRTEQLEEYQVALVHNS